jgi:hypothetical protein
MIGSACFGSDGRTLVVWHPQSQGRRRWRTPLLGKTPGAAAEKRSQMPDGLAVEFDPKHLQDFPPRESAAVDGSVGSLKLRDIVSRVATPAQAHDVEPYNAARLAVEKHVGRHILNHAGMAAHHSQPSDSAELMNGYGARDKSPILDRDVTAEQGSIGKNAVIGHHDVVAKVDAGHHVIVIAYGCNAFGLHGTVDRGMFAEDVVIADHDPADFSRPGDMLRRTTDHDMLAKLVVTTGGDA